MIHLSGSHKGYRYQVTVHPQPIKVFAADTDSVAVEKIKKHYARIGRLVEVHRRSTSKILGTQK